MTLPRRYWHEMTWDDFQAVDPSRWLAVLPVSAIEQHGPHLPVWVDARVNRGILDRALELVPADLPVILLPSQQVGKSNEHIAYPGTLTLSSSTLTALWTEIGESVVRAGVRKMLIFNSHGGQPQIADIVARDLRVNHDMLCATHTWFAGGVPDGLFEDPQGRWGIHADEIETSLMMHLEPELVKSDKLANFRPRLADNAERYQWLNLIGPVGAGWQAQDLHPSGAAGDASLATPEKGKAMLEHAARVVVKIWTELVDYPLDALAKGPLEQ